jgi:hypothetical protein
LRVAHIADAHSAVRGFDRTTGDRLQRRRQLIQRHAGTGRDIDHLSRNPRCVRRTQHAVDDVRDVRKVARLFAIAVNRHRTAADLGRDKRAGVGAGASALTEAPRPAAAASLSPTDLFLEMADSRIGPIANGIIASPNNQILEGFTLPFPINPIDHSFNPPTNLKSEIRLLPQLLESHVPHAALDDAERRHASGPTSAYLRRRC